MNNLEACLTPAIFEEHKNKEAIVVVIDTLRASSAIVTALSNGAECLIPVATVDEARSYKEKGYMVAAERDGYVLDFADFGNSPFNFESSAVKGKSIVYSTTNGTRVIGLASECHMVVVGAFLNISSLSSWLTGSGRDVILFCAGWKNRINIEDTVYTGALASLLIESGKYTTICDETRISIDLWSIARENPLEYIDKAAQRHRLREKGLDDCIPYCHERDVTEVIPVLRDGKLVRLEKQFNRS